MTAPSPRAKSLGKMQDGITEYSPKIFTIDFTQDDPEALHVKHISFEYELVFPLLFQELKVHILKHLMNNFLLCIIFYYLILFADVKYLKRSH